MFKSEFVSKLNIKKIEIDGIRYYQTPDGTFPSVTTVLGWMSDDSFLEKWKERVGESEAEKITQRSAIRGTKIHKILEKFLLNDGSYKDLIKVPSDKLFFNQIKPTLENRLGTIRGIELPLYSKKLKVAGTTDLFADFDGIPSIIDFKTSSKAKKKEWILNYFIQMTSYAFMTYERYKIKIPQIVILMMTDDNDFTIFQEKTRDYAEETVKLFKQSQLQYPSKYLSSL